MIKKINFLLSLIFLVILNSYAFDGSVLEEKKRQFETYQQKNYQESIYVHVDKRYYLTGEFIKFKVYCLERLTDQPSRLSKVAYVEILDRENNPQLQSRIELINGKGSGEFYLPMNIASGNFIIRGYTRWMRNYSSESYFHAMLKIINPFKKPGLKPVSDSTFIDFFPEGGKLINGLETKVVFQGKNNLGIPIGVEGRLMANDTIVVTQFESIKNGLGHFNFTPDLINRYHIELKNGDSLIRHNFIPIASRGFNTKINWSADACEINVFCNETSILQPTDEIAIIMHKKGEILLSDDIRMQNGKAQFLVDRSLVKDVVSISFFDPGGKYLVERKVFSKEARRDQNVLKLEKDKIGQRELVEIDLAGLEDMRDLTVSVSANHSYFNGNLPGLDQCLMLDNSLKLVYGIEDYFNTTEEEAQLLINDLLIAYPTQKNEDIFTSSRKNPQLIPEYRSVLVSGNLNNKQTNEPGFGITTYLSVPGKITQIYADKSAADGSLLFEAGNFYGSTQVVLQNDYTKDSIYSIEVDNPYCTEYADFVLPEFDLDEELENLLVKKSQNMQVFNANLKLSPNSETISSQDSASFYIQPDTRYNLDDYTRFVVMEEVMREYVAYVNVRKNKDGFHFMVVDIEKDIVYNDNPLMLLDGVPVFDADDIIALDPLKIEKIETIKTRFGRGDLDCKGIVTYTSYMGDLAGYNLHKNAVALDYDGLKPVKKYTFPRYSNAYERKNTTPDFRSNLYWQSGINMDVQDKTTITFYTSDDTDTYEVRINGINGDGQIISLSKSFEVTKASK